MKPRQLAVFLALGAAACDPASAAADPTVFRSAELEVEGPGRAFVGELASLALDGDFGGDLIVWTVVDPEPEAVTCVAGFGPDGLFTATHPGRHVVRALAVDPESLALQSWAETEVWIAGEALAEAQLPDSMTEVIETAGFGDVAGIDPTPFIDWDEVAGIDPTPFTPWSDESEVSGIDPTPFHGAWSYPDLAGSLSAGCLLDPVASTDG